MSEEMTMQGMGATPAPDWLNGFIQAVAGQAIAPRDGRVKSLWVLLKQRQLLARSVWLRALLMRIWKQGLPARPRPRTTQRLMRRLQQWGILPGPAVTSGLAPVQARYPVGVRPMHRVGFRPLRPVGVRPLQPVRVRPLRPGAGQTWAPCECTAGGQEGEVSGVGDHYRAPSAQGLGWLDGYIPQGSALYKCLITSPQPGW